MKSLNIKKQLVLIVILSLLLPSLSTAGSLSFGSFSPFNYYPSFSMPTPKIQKPAERQQANEDKSVDMAKKAVEQYMQERSEGTYKIGEIEDRGNSYRAEIFESDGNVKEILVIDKQTNKIQSLK